MSDHLIQRIDLFTAVPLAEMIAFYHDRLGFEIAKQTEDRVEFQTGQTRLSFATAKPELGKAFYHFAFNIPHNKLLAARTWQLERSPLVLTPERLRDPDYPDDVRHFRSWNAHSLFFFDPALNVVEYIARHDLKNDAPEPDRFTVADILYASEIGFIVTDQGAAARMLHDKLGLNAYPNGTADWWAMGDERGLLLCLPKGRVFGETTKTPVAFDVFPTSATVRGTRGRDIEFEEYPYAVRTEG